MFSTYKVAFYMTSYRYHVKRQDIGQPIRLFIILDTIEFLCAGTDAATRFALAAGDWWTVEMRPTTALVVRGVAQLGFQPSCTRIPCAIDNKKDLSTSKLVSSPLLLSESLIYVRDYCGCLPMYARIPPST